VVAKRAAMHNAHGCPIRATLRTNLHAQMLSAKLGEDPATGAAPAVYLASDEAAFVQGPIIHVDGARISVAGIAGA
jgi:hypothetical protein